MSQKYVAPNTKPEVVVDPFSPFWRLNEPIDPNGDPLDLLIRAEEGDEIAIEIISNERNQMNYLQHVLHLRDTNKISRDGVVQVLKSTVNWANGSLMSLSQIRIANMAKRGDPDLLPTVDDAAGEVGDEHIQNQRNAEQGNEQQLTLTQRGDCLASIRRAAMEIADELGLQGFDRPMEFAAYVESRISGVRKSVATKADIKKIIDENLGVTEDEAKVIFVEAQRKQAEKLEAAKEDLIAEDSAYEDDTEYEEALSTLGAVSALRVRVKIIDDVMRECSRLLQLIPQYPGLKDLSEKRTNLLYDAFVFEDELKAFEKAHKAHFSKELAGTNRLLPAVNTSFQRTLDLSRRQAAERQVAA